jgi:predicted membrane protein
METQDSRNPGLGKENSNSNFRNGRALGGLVIITVGTLLLVKKMGVDLPGWIFSWEMILITIGIYIGARHRFKDLKWLIPVAIGVAFLIGDEINMDIHRYIWPIIIIAIGLVMILRPHRTKRSEEYWRDFGVQNNERSAEDYIDSTTIFGGTKKNIISKDFKGGESFCMFGGAEINLMQADINGRVVIELTQVFGGTKLVVPPHWKLQTEEVVSIFGGLDDKRPIIQSASVDDSKVLILRGTCLFGGIDIKSY